MGIEIERKFLVDKTKWKELPKDKGAFLRQGYMLSDPDKTIRVRVMDAAGYLTIKGTTVGSARPEYEYPIPVTDARELLDKFCTTGLSKVRYDVWHEGRLWEVDEFLGDNEGLIIAEIELSSEEDVFSMPLWAGKEVTGDAKYYNSRLSVHPYNRW